jgi:hypothetical protein
VKPGGEVIHLGNPYPWRRTIAATSFVLGMLVGAVYAWAVIFFTEAPK